MSSGSDTKFLSIPVSGKALATFIGELLGQRRTTEKAFRNYSFTVNLDWLINLHLIIDQRITAQNVGGIAAFKGSFYFDTGRVHNLFSYDAFVSYRDISNDVCTAVEMSWGYLVQFPGKDLPEKQEIEIKIAIDDRYKENALQDKYSFTDFLVLGTDRSSLIKVVIAYTDYTWGEDLLSHIGRYIESSFQRPDFIAKCIERGFNRNMVWLIPIFIVPLSFYIDNMFDQRKWLSLKSLEQSLILSSDSLDNLGSKINSLIESQKRNFQYNPFGFLLSLGYCVVMGALLAAALGIRRASFININSYSAALFQRYRYRITLIHVSIILGFGIGLMSSVFASKILEIMKGVGIF